MEWTDSRAIQIPIYFAGYNAKKKTILLLGNIASSSWIEGYDNDDDDEDDDDDQRRSC